MNKLSESTHEIHSTGSPVVLITGASSGFGLLTALRFAALGYEVIATMRDLRKRTALMTEAHAAQIDARIHCHRLDVTVKQDIEAVIHHIEDEYGRLDILVNNAGFAVGGMVEEVPMDTWRDLFETNFFAVVQLTQAVLPILRRQRSGMIINVGSISGRIGLPGYAPYSASKYALSGFSESLRLELKPFGIDVILVEPGAYKTPIWDKGFAHIERAASSPYHDMLNTVLTYSRKTAESAPDPDEVARKIVHISTQRKPKLRYTLGKGSTLIVTAKTLLPWRWFEQLIVKILKNTSKST